MKKLVFYIPVILAIFFYGVMAIAGGFAISPIVIAWIALFCISGFIMSKNRFWGAFLGLLPALHLIYMGTQETGQIVNEMPVGIVILFFYTICGYFVLKKYKSS